MPNSFDIMVNEQDKYLGSAASFPHTEYHVLNVPIPSVLRAELLGASGGTGQLLFNEHGQVVSSSDPAAAVAVQAALSQAQQQLQNQQWNQQQQQQQQQLLSGSQVQQVMVDPTSSLQQQLQGKADA